MSLNFAIIGVLFYFGYAESENLGLTITMFSDMERTYWNVLKTLTKDEKTSTNDTWPYEENDFKMKLCEAIVKMPYYLGNGLESPTIDLTGYKTCPEALHTELNHSYHYVKKPIKKQSIFSIGIKDFSFPCLYCTENVRIENVKIVYVSPQYKGVYIRFLYTLNTESKLVPIATIQELMAVRRKYREQLELEYKNDILYSITEVFLDEKSITKLDDFYKLETCATVFNKLASLDSDLKPGIFYIHHKIYEHKQDINFRIEMIPEVSKILDRKAYMMECTLSDASRNKTIKVYNVSRTFKDTYDVYVFEMGNEGLYFYKRLCVPLLYKVPLLKMPRV